jgi:ABC-type nitrate/sulfonate/bicarbonate transport system substrate-binding protein
MPPRTRFARFRRSRPLHVLTTGLLAAAVAGCRRSAPPPESAPRAATYADALARVRRRLPASRYMTDACLTGAPPAPLPGPVVLRVGMPWILNDEEAPWYVAAARGYFRDAGLDVRLLPGGPGRDSLQLLAGGAIDVATAESGSFVLKLAASPSGADIVAVGAVFRRSPYCWLCRDRSIPRAQESTRRLTPADLVGRRIGLQPGYDYVLSFLQYRYGLARDRLRIMPAGALPDPLIAGVFDYYAAWIDNQPRLLEREGYRNWTAFRFSDWGLREYCSVAVVRRPYLRKHADVVRAYLFALGRGIRFELDHPGQAAAITLAACRDPALTRAFVLQRFAADRALILGSGRPPLQAMRPEAWDELAALLYLSGEIDPR